jgi:hypothetical protein
MDSELLRVWQLVHELSDQLAHNQKIANTLQSQAGALKVCPQFRRLFEIYVDPSLRAESGRAHWYRLCATAVQHGHFERCVTNGFSSLRSLSCVSRNVRV